MKVALVAIFVLIMDRSSNPQGSQGDVHLEYCCRRALKVEIEANFSLPECFRPLITESHLLAVIAAYFVPYQRIVVFLQL